MRYKIVFPELGRGEYEASWNRQDEEFRQAILAQVELLNEKDVYSFQETTTPKLYFSYQGKRYSLCYGFVAPDIVLLMPPVEEAI